MKTEKISLDNAKPHKLFYFVASAVIYRASDSRCLILKRSAEEKVHPNKYCAPGGKLEWTNLDLTKPAKMNGDVYDFDNALENLLIRECYEEAGVQIDSTIHYLNSVAFVRPDGIPVMLIKCAAQYTSGEVVLEPGAFTDFAWVNATEALNYDCIQGTPEEVKKTIEIYTKL